MKLLNNIITVFFLFFYSSLQAEIIKEIVIKGNKRVSEETIKIYGGIEINKDYSDKYKSKYPNDQKPKSLGRNLYDSFSFIFFSDGYFDKNN